MTAQSADAKGRAELRAARRLSQGPLRAAFLFSVFVNLLMLTSPLYMLQVYDRVLASRSEATLVALSLLASFLFVIMALLDYARSAVLARIGARFQETLDPRVMSAAFRALTQQPDAPAALSARNDLDQLGRIWSSPVLTACLDLPWTPIFTAALFVFHPLMGWMAVAGALLLVGLTWANQRATSEATNAAALGALAVEREAEMLKNQAEVIRALGMSASAFRRWNLRRAEALRQQMRGGDTALRYGAATRSLRLFLQSAVLGLGAWLVIRGELSAGAMIAGSILLGRALQPIEVAIGQWPSLTRTKSAAARLAALLQSVPPEAARTPLPRPEGRLEVAGLTLVPAGARIPTLRGVSFGLCPGQAMGVIGPSGAGKSSLARALIGLWPPAAGTIRLDGATLDQFDPDILGRLVGYLPQSVSLFDGTIAENIARLDSDPDPEAIVAAAKKAGVHEMILHLPAGYDSRVSAIGGRLSGGQIQRIGLARAFYGDPVLIVLDEPNSNLDNDGSLALNQAIRAAKAGGAAVLIMAHRPAAIQECELLLVLKDGMVANLGPREQVLRDAVRNAADIGPRAGAPRQTQGITP